jgi:hypothetical protein
MSQPPVEAKSSTMGEMSPSKKGRSWVFKTSQLLFCPSGGDNLPSAPECIKGL